MNLRPGDHVLVDLDKTLAHFDHWRGPEHIGEPVPAMLARVKAWRAAGIEVRIFTSRVSLGDDPRERRIEVARSTWAIERWCLQHLGEVLPITCEKSYQCAAIYDDRAFQVVANEGRIATPCAVCGACGVCGDFHFYDGRGCTEHNCSLKHDIDHGVSE
jgi:hypothetical protein